jgi:catechol 2,3-dioxygenase-like lactoylglutathione lyase family enzyme
MAETPVDSAAPPNAVVTGHDHVTLIGSNEADTMAFYRDVLGLPLVMRQPNLDRPAVTHLYFDAGDGRLVTFFVDEDRDSHEGPQEPGVGSVHHVAFRVEAAAIPEIRDRLREAGHEWSEFDRGAFHALYTRDHNGLTVELAADVYEIPDDRRGEVLARAHALRVEAGATHVERSHVEEALADLGLPVVETGAPEAPSGTGGL